MALCIESGVSSASSGGEEAADEEPAVSSCMVHVASVAAWLNGSACPVEYQYHHTVDGPEY